MKSVLVTGRPGVGKTSLVEAIAREFPQLPENSLRARSVSVVCAKAFARGDAGGKRLQCSPTLARAGTSAKYGVDVPTFEQLALPALEDAVLRRRTVVIDEIGKIELASKRFCDVVQKALDSPAIVGATIMERAHPLADQIGQPDPTTPDNRLLTSVAGVYLMRSLMDEVRFERGGTVVNMRKKPNVDPLVDMKSLRCKQSQAPCSCASRKPRAALELENLALRHQIGVLQRSASKRVKLTPLDHLLWA